VAVNRRLLAASIGTAVIVSVIGGWAISRGDGGSDADDEVTYDSRVVEQYPSIGTNADVEGDRLPDIAVQDNDGNEVDLASFAGTPTIINYWFSTCAPCSAELPAFAAVHAELGDRIRFVGVNPSDTPETNVSFAADRGVRYELLRDPDGGYASAVGVASAPFTVFVDASGTIVRQTGVLEEDELREFATELLG
jgi:peroxiredoxin